LFDFRNFTAPQIKVGLYLFGPLLLISGFVLLFGDVIINILSFVAVVGGGGASGMGMVTGTEPFLVIIAFVGFPSLLLGFAVFAVLGGIWARWRSRLIVRRKIERGTYSFQSLTKLLGTSDFLTAFWTVSPKAHHEMSSPSDVA